VIETNPQRCHYGASDSARTNSFACSHIRPRPGQLTRKLWTLHYPAATQTTTEEK
ncbi:hypothetical protein V5799_021909, partial [Amblyomma americanum]